MSSAETGVNEAAAPTKNCAPEAVKHLTVVERVTRGEVARATMPHASHAAWAPAPDRRDPIAILEEQARTRLPELVPIRYGRMMQSPFAFYRGGAAIMAADLAGTPTSKIRVQACGDAHLMNFGAFGTPERSFIFDISDFDETLPGPWEWDIKRLAASCEIAGRERGFKRKERRAMVETAVGEYRKAMLGFADARNLEVWYERLDLTAIRARWPALATPKAMKSIERGIAEARTYDRVNDQLRIVAQPPLIVPIEDLEPSMTEPDIEEYIRRALRTYRRSLQADRRHLLETFRYVHLARKATGVGSVGMRIWIVLLAGRDESDVLVLQAKEAQPSVLEPYFGRSAYSSCGRRVVEGQRRMQATSDIFLGWDRVAWDGQARDYYFRQIWDWKFSANVETMALPGLTLLCVLCAWTLARAHARSGDRIAIAAYLGKDKSFERAIAEFAIAYADQNERDHQALLAAVKEGRLVAEAGL
jgi:uncharacterized protein (DUF2252 family)